MIPCKRMLVLAPHTDDAELGCGATMARQLRQGGELHIVVFSAAEDSLPAGKHPDTLLDEFAASMRLLGVPDKNWKVHRFPVRKLSYHRQEVLEVMVQARRELEPDVVLLPAATDLHQDHQVVHQEGLRACKDLSVLGYELPWNHIGFSAHAFVQISESDLEMKWKMLGCYATQIELKRPYFTREFIDGLARVRGVQVRTPFAEAFEVYRLALRG